MVLIGEKKQTKFFYTIKNFLKFFKNINKNWWIKKKLNKQILKNGILLI
jgi:hypothetical protein